MAISIKTPEDIAGLRIAGRLAAELLDYLTPFVKPGVSTGELDRLAYDYTVNVQKCIPACLGYTPPGMTPYPATTCISINHVVCHGIPSDKKILKSGDIVNIDVTSIKNGYHGDTSRMFIVGKPTIAGKRLVDLAFNTMWAGIDAVRPGGCFNDIGVACQRYADQNGISVVRDYGGHGIGKGFHEEPHVRLRARHGLHGRTHGECRTLRRHHARRRLDGGHEGPFAFRAVGAHGACDGNRLRRPHGEQGHAGASRLREGLEAS